MLNKVFLMGRLVADPELKQTPNGVSVTSFRIAVDRDYKNKETGEREVDFFSIVAWRQTAEFICERFCKGRKIVVVGTVQNRDYTDRDGNKRAITEVITETVYFADSQQSQNAEPANETPAKQKPATKTEQFTELPDEDAGDLPF